jgi:hypothetical protein
VKGGRARRLAIRVGLVIAGAVLVIQLVPYGRDHSNPPVVAEPPWDRAQTRELAVRACFDCHSNETRWPVYSNLAPASWLVQSHVDTGRRALNFSEFDLAGEEADEAAVAVADGEMPPASYLLAHPDARLSTRERDVLVRGLIATAESSRQRAPDGAGWVAAGDDDDDD